VIDIGAERIPVGVLCAFFSVLCRLLSFEEYLALAIEVHQENEELLCVEEVAWICFLLTFRWKLEQGGQL